MDEIVEHRFIQIHHACQKTNTDTHWTFLLDKATPSIAVSHSCEKIIDRVQTRQLDFLQTLTSLQNLVLSCQDSAKNTVFLRTITRLLLLDTRIVFHHHKSESCPVHPFALLIRQKPQICFDILEQVDFILQRNAWTVLKEFIYAVFLTENHVESSALLSRIQQALLLSKHTEFSDAVYTEMVQLVLCYPMQKNSNKFFSLIDFLIWMNHTSKSDKANYAYALLDRVLTVASQGYSVKPYLIRMDRIVSLNSQVIAMDVLWISLSFLLLKVQTIEEQQLIMHLMKSALREQDMARNVLCVSYLPLYQLLSELNDKETSRELKGLKEDTLSLITYLDQDKTPAKTSTHHISSIVKDHNIYGLLGHLFVYLNKLYQNMPPVLEAGYNTGSEDTLALNMLFSTPFVYSQDQLVQCTVYTRMAELTCLQETCYKFPLFLFLLRMLRVSFANPRLVTHIFRDVLPMLANTNDPTITSKILQVVLSAISAGGNSSMAILAVKSLAHLYQRQPRVWQELKKVFSEWVLRRKSGTVRRKIDLTKTGPTKMELAILTTMRDVCALRPRECAPDILPMVISLLQSCQDLSMASLSLLLTIINHCVKSGLAEPRSIWNVSVVYLAMFAMEQGTQRSELLVQQLCAFYAIAGARNDTSEPYLQFKESLLTEYIFPLIESQDQEAAQHAMYALSHFPAQDISTILPEKATDYIQKIISPSDQPNAKQHLLLATLISNELDHMRRGLFKEEAVSIKQHVSNQEQQVTNDLGQVVSERELELQTMFKTQWEDARVAPGLRSGYTIAMLNTMDFSDKNMMEDMSKTHWYRFMVTSFTDISLTDHLLLRVSSLESWESFFRTALETAGNKTEAIVSALVKDLLVRLERSTVPGVTCNIFLALTGLVNMIRVIIPSFATSCATGIIDILMKNYISLAGSPLSHSAHLMSEEVQFAARFSLGHLATCIISNEILVTNTYHTLTHAATNTNIKSRNIDTAVDLVQFANGYAAGYFVGALTVYPTATEHVEKLRESGTNELIKYCGAKVTSDSCVMGILMGLASALKAKDVAGEILDFALGSLKTYLKGDAISKGRLLGSTWLCAVGALEENQVEYTLSSVVESTLAAASNDPSLAQHFYHFTIPYAQIQYHSYLHAGADHESSASFYNQALEPLFNSIQSDDASSNYRIASLFALGSLLGAQYLNSTRTSETDFLEAQRYHATFRRPALDKLAAVAGLTVRSAPTGNLKSGRVAAAVCGKVIEHAKWLMYTLKSDRTQEAAASALAVSSSSEPASYSRLNSNTSYLRAVFDQLVQLALTPSARHNIDMLLRSLIDTSGPLPPVNWFAVMLKLVKQTPKLCFQFASTHAATSFSLSEFLITQTHLILNTVNSATTNHCPILFEEGNAFGVILELSGLTARHQAKKGTMRRGMNAVVKKVSLSESRVLELVELIGRKFTYMDHETKSNVLARLSEHLPSEDKSLEESKIAFVQSIRDCILRSITLVLLNTKGHDHETLLCQAVECSITDISQLFPTGKLQDWSDIEADLVFGKTVSLCEFYRIKPDQKQVLIKYISTAITHLIGFTGKACGESVSAWQTIASTICDDCQSDKEALSWIIRVLDAFVVYVSGFNSPEQMNDMGLYDSIRIGLYAILVQLRCTPEETSLDKIEIMDTAFLLNSFVSIGNDHKAEQEQIVKRVFKLLDMISKLQATLCTEFFGRVILGFPEEQVSQNETRY